LLAASSSAIGIRIVQGVLDALRQELMLKIDGEKPWAGINMLVAGHPCLSQPNALSSLDIPFGSRQDAPMLSDYLQLHYQIE